MFYFTAMIETQEQSDLVTAMFDKYYDPLLAHARYYLQGKDLLDEAADLVQDTFCKVADRPDVFIAKELAYGEAFYFYLCNTFHNLCNDKWKKETRRREILPKPLSLSDYSDNVSIAPLTPGLIQQICYQDLLLKGLDECHLMPDQRIVVLHRYYFGYSIQETAEMLRFTKSKVRDIINRFRNMMRAQCKEEQ